ncbi:MAG: insulinase family protein [Chloroflexi bacterium]|nr:insulinase family protein [Chloroflexota bacterium]
MFQRSVLDNQLRVLTSNMPHTRSVSITLCIGAGSRYESADLAGVSHFIEHLPFKGTRSWPTAQSVSEAIEGVGGVMNASTDREMTVFWCKVAVIHFRTALAVMLDMILNPILDPVEVEKEREIIQEELRMTYDQPTYKVDLLIDEALWPDQAMGRDVGGTPETVSAISQEAIREYMTRQYNPANTVIAVAGNITHEEVVSLLEDATADWRPLEPLDWERAVDGHNQQPTVSMEMRRTDQSHLCLALPGLALCDPDRYNLALMNVILGDGMSSRLFLSLREDQGLAYDVSSTIHNFHDCGSIVIYCGVEPKKSRAALRGVLHELQSMREEVPEQELVKAKEYTKGRLLLRMEDTRAVTGWLASQELLQDQVFTPDEVVQLIDNVSAPEIARVANELVDPDKLKLAVVGPHRSENAFLKLLHF